MGTGDNLTITLTGGGPWGFRLIGGEGYPLQIAKIRKRSKAHSNGLQEGDTILSINGVSVQGKSHQEAMYHVDNAGDSLSIKVLRDSSQKPLQNVQQSVQPMTNGVDPQPVVIQGPSKSTSYVTQNGNVTRKVTTQQHQQTSADGRTTQVFVQQQQTVTSNAAPSNSQWQRVEFQQSSQTATSQSQPCIKPVKMFNVKNIVNESYKENVTPPAFVAKSESPAPVLFKVRDIKGSMGQGDTYNGRDVYSPPEVVPTQAYVDQPQYSPPQVSSEPPEVAPKPSPVPPPPPAPPLPPQHAVFPSDEPLMFPVPKGPFIRLEETDAHKYRREDSEVIYIDNQTFDENANNDYHHLPIFAPKVEIQSEDPRHIAQMYVEASGRPDLLPLDLTRTASLESGEYTDPGTPDTGSTATRKKKKLYSDSAFYDAPGADYPTIEQQVVLCKKIARSLTSAANRKARGAKMFAKRKFKSMRWIHDGESHHEESSLGDIADLRDLESELHQEDGGVKPLFTFRIPNVKHRIGLPDEEPFKMSISQDEFEALRLQKKKCDHRSVSPSTCHSLVADLSSTRNKGAKLFQKRQARSEKWVIDETNAKKPMMPQAQLNALLAQNVPKGPTPWEAALSNEGRVDHAFDQMDNRNSAPPPTQNNFMPQPSVPPPATKVMHHNLKSTGESMNVVTGPNYNRTPKGWGSGPATIPANYSLPADAHHVNAQHDQYEQRSSWKQEQPPPPPPKPLKQQDNYNRKIRAWNSGADTNSQMATTNAEWFRGPGGNMGPQQQYGYQATHQYNHMASNMMPASDL